MIGQAPKPLLPQPVVATGVDSAIEEAAAVSRPLAEEVVVSGLKNLIIQAVSVRHSDMVLGKMESMSLAVVTCASKKNFSVTLKTLPYSILVLILTSMMTSLSRPLEQVCLSLSTRSPTLLWTLFFWRTLVMLATTTPPLYKSIQSLSWLTIGI